MTGPHTTAARVFAHRRILQVTPDGYLAAIRVLAKSAHLRHGPITAVIGIANGGLAPAQALGALLTAPVYRVDAQHNPTDALYTQANGHVTYDLLRLASTLAGRRLAGRILLVDDICGTGATFHALRPALDDHLTSGATIYTVTLCCNAGAVHEPDLWLWTVDDWVRFPWEPALGPGMTVENLLSPGRAQPS
ncbi:MAG: phosphoribosyltransferase [Pseudonocardiaceae bacterium]